jgi:hypothetical protein
MEALLRNLPFFKSAQRTSFGLFSTATMEIDTTSVGQTTQTRFMQPLKIGERKMS